jgi:hypothetical protein
VQVIYTPRFQFARDASIGDYDRKHNGNAAKLISKLEKPADWSFDGVLSNKGALDRIREITYPRTNNGKLEKKEVWSCQLDVADVGSGSKDRLVLACRPGDVAIAQRESGTVPVGREEYKKIEATLTLHGTFRAIEKSH